MNTVYLARSYHVRMTQMDLEELGPDVGRDTFKAYFGIPEDADDDPGYKRDPDFDLSDLNRQAQAKDDAEAAAFNRKLEQTARAKGLIR